MSIDDRKDPHSTIPSPSNTPNAASLFNHIDIVAIRQYLSLPSDASRARLHLWHTLVVLHKAKAISTPVANIDFALLQTGFVGS